MPRTTPHPTYRLGDTDDCAFDSLGGFADARRDWFEIAVVPAVNCRNDGWDVVLRVGGTYFSHRQATLMARWWAEQFGAVLRKHQSKL